MMFDVIAFDADDTLWENEAFYQETEAKLREILLPYKDIKTINQILFETDVRNLSIYGYGIKPFMLSMIEVAIQVSDGSVSGAEIQQIISWGRQMLTAEVCLLANVKETVASLSQSYDLMVITKGDLLDQTAKLDRSGLKDYFRFVEVVNEKNSQTYIDLLERYRVDPQRFFMVGNSLKSDVLPVAMLGGCAVHVPHHTTWEHERVSEEESAQLNYHSLEHLGQVVGLLDELERNGK